MLKDLVRLLNGRRKGFAMAVLVCVLPLSLCVLLGSCYGEPVVDDAERVDSVRLIIVVG